MTQQEILGKIETLAYNSDFKSLSLSQIANGLGIQKASLYYHFSSKEDMQEKLIDYSWNKFSLAMKEIFQFQKMWEILEKYFHYIETQKNFFAWSLQNWYCNDEKMKSYIQKRYKPILEEIFEKLQQNFWFSQNKSFIFWSILQDITIKRCVFWECGIEKKHLIPEISSLFSV